VALLRKRRLIAQSNRMYLSFCSIKTSFYKDNPFV